jgi:type IV secretory pathway VirB10-like protein
MSTGIHNSLGIVRKIARDLFVRIQFARKIFAWKPVHSMTRTLSSTSAFLIIPVFAMIGFGGCPKQPVKPKITGVGVTQPPHEPFPQDAPAPAPPQVDSPELPTLEPQMSSALSNPPRPPAPRRATATTEPEPEPTKPEAPQISPQLSADEKSRAQASTDADIRAAQQVLDTAAHHTLNATQQDMSDKITSFLTQAREAISVADWLRAKSLAQKAHVLATELVRSF